MLHKLSTSRPHLAHLFAELTDREVGYINRIREIYLDIEKDSDLPHLWRNVITEHLFRAVDALLEHVARRK